MLSDLYESMNGAMPGLGQRDAGIHQPSTQQPNDADHLSQFFWQRPLEWWHHLPELASGDVRLRELRLSDAPSLAKTLGSAKVGEHLSSGPKTVAEAAARDEVLRYAATIHADGRAEVGVRSYARDHPFARIKGGDNIIAFTTERYHELPLIVQGPGAGPSVTAGGVFADLLRLAAYVGAPS